MANFLDRVADTLNNTVNEISDSAKEFSEVSCIKGKIRSQEKIVENTYIELGKMYYEAHKNDTEGEYMNQISRITSAKSEIEMLHNDISNIKGK